MTRTARLVTIGGIGIAALVIVLIFVTEHRLQRRLDVLEPEAQRYREICGGVKAALYVDRTALATAHDREAVLSRVAGACGDDSFVMLQRCLPEPFPLDAWTACRARGDTACLGKILIAAEASLDYAARTDDR